MRKALADTFTDPEFQADAEKIGLIVNAPQTGEQLQEVIESAYATPSRVVERLRKLNNPVSASGAARARPAHRASSKRGDCRIRPGNDPE